MPYSSDTDKMLIFFHGNAEDIGLSYDLLTVIKNQLSVNVLAVEYPGYGIYWKQSSVLKTNQYEEASEKSILEDAYFLMQFITKIVGMNKENIIIMGRSIGSGPATELASLFNPSSLILMSAFTSLR